MRDIGGVQKVVDLVILHGAEHGERVCRGVAKGLCEGVGSNLLSHLPADLHVCDVLVTNCTLSRSSWRHVVFIGIEEQLCLAGCNKQEEREALHSGRVKEADLWLKRNFCTEGAIEAKLATSRVAANRANLLLS